MVRWIFALLVIVQAAPAGAWELRLVETSPGVPLVIGDVFSFDVFLDTQGENGLVGFSVSLAFDPTVLTYRSDLSDAEDYYPLYAPAMFVPGKSTLPTWLLPVADPPAVSASPWSGLDQVNVAFAEVRGAASQGTATNLYLATLAFELTGAGPSPIIWSLDGLGDFFDVDGLDVSGDVSLVGGGQVGVPEPTTVALVALGLAVLARRQRCL